MMTAYDTNGISVVVPVFNGASTLPLLARRLRTVLEQIGRPYEILLVNDGSRDRSWDGIVALAADQPRLRAMDLMRNYGQHNALLCGIRDARYPITVTLDDDLQNPPEEIPRLLEKLDEGYDLVYGTPETMAHGTMRNAASWATRFFLQETMGAAGALSASTFRAFRTSLRDAFERYDGPNPSIEVLLTWGTDRVASVNVQHHRRAAGRSNYTLGKLVAHTFSMITGYSPLPLQIVTTIGFAFTVFGAGIFVIVLVNYFVRRTDVPGFTFLASIIAIFAGVQLFALGVLGEYLARIHFRTMGRPVYRVRRRLTAPDDGCNVR
jgi:undecaprenyl-phosphate 4-deoxy-4-formamido-L-arabinose transferase